MTLGRTLLIVSLLCVVFDLSPNVLESLRVSKKTASLALSFSFALSFLPQIPLETPVNIGGELIPAAFCVYLIATDDSAVKKARAILAALFTGALLSLIKWVFPAASVADWGMMLYGLAAGIFAFVFGGRPRGALCAGLLGVLLSELIPSDVTFSWDVALIAALFALSLAHLSDLIVHTVLRGKEREHA